MYEFSWCGVTTHNYTFNFKSLKNNFEKNYA